MEKPKKRSPWILKMTFRKLSLLTLILCCFISCTKSQDETSTTDTQTIKGETAKPKAQEIGSESLSNKNWLKILDNKNSEDLDKWFSKNPNKELLMGNNWKALLKNKNLEKKPDIYNQLALRLSLYYNFSCKFLSFINFNYFKQTNNKLKVEKKLKNC